MADYIKLDHEELRRRREQDLLREEGGGGSSYQDEERVPVIWMRLKGGDRRAIRVLPPWTAEGINAYLPVLYFSKHWKLGPDGNGFHNCPRKTSWEHKKRIRNMLPERRKQLGLELILEDAPCYTCERVDEGLASDNKAEQERANHHKSNNNYLYQVIDAEDSVWTGKERDSKGNPIDVPQRLIGMPKIQFLRLSKRPSAQIATILDSPGDFGMVTDPYEGQVLIIKRTGDNFDNTEYGVSATGKFGPLFKTATGEPDEEMIQAALDGMFDLDEHYFFRIPTYEETRAIYLGEGKDTDSTPEQTSSPNPTEFSYQDWVNYAQTGRVLNRQQIADEHGWKLNEVPECYEEEPDHTDADCNRCQLRNHCAQTFCSKTGKYSTKAPAGKAAGKSAGKGSYSPAPHDDDIPF